MNFLLSYWSADALWINFVITLHLLGAAAAGLLVGYERSYHGRAAGMRTYALVCLSTCTLVTINAFPGHWFGGLAGTPTHSDPGDSTRVIQGIVTGVGFLGAGVIMKEGYSIRGLSTSASIWATAAIGVVIGLGFYVAAFCAVFIVICIMTAMRWAESALPHQSSSTLRLVFRATHTPTHDDLVARLAHRGFAVVNWSYGYQDDAKQFEYSLVLMTSGPDHSAKLVADLAKSPEIVAFNLAPAKN